MKDEPIFELTPEDFEDIEFPTSSLSRSLDELLAYARSGKHDFAPWVPVIGMPGSGKTSIVKAWLEHNKLKNWYISGIRSMSEIEVEYYPDVPNEPQIRLISGQEPADLLTPKKKKVNVIFASDEIDDVDDQTVIVIDDYDRASEEVRKELFNLVAFHHVIDPRANNEKKIKVLNPLIMIVIIDSLNTEVLSDAEKKLFAIDRR